MTNMMDLVQLASLPSVLKRGEIQDRVLESVGKSINSTMEVSFSEAKAKETEAWARTFEKVMSRKHNDIEELKCFKKEMGSF